MHATKRRPRPIPSFSMLHAESGNGQPCTGHETIIAQPAIVSFPDPAAFWVGLFKSISGLKMAAEPQITANDLAEETDLPIQYLDKIFHEEHAHLLAEFCHPWENISYHLKLTKVDISAIKNDKGTTELRGIAMLETWSEKFAHKATYRVLIEALIQSKCAKQAFNLCRKIKHEMLTDHSYSDNSDDLSNNQRATNCHETINEELVPKETQPISAGMLSISYVLYIILIG